MSTEPRARAFPHLDGLRHAYDRDAGRRNAFSDLQWRPSVLEEWLQSLPESPRLLELGAGTGQLALHVQGLGASVEAIDLSAENVAYCRQRGVSAQVGDFRLLGAMAGLGLFAGVYAINSLLHVPRCEHAAVLTSVCEILLPGGGVLLVSWGGRDEEGIWREDSCDPPRFFSFYDDAAFASLAFDGFEVVRRGVLSAATSDGLRPQLLMLKKLPRL